MTTSIEVNLNKVIRDAFGDSNINTIDQFCIKIFPECFTKKGVDFEKDDRYRFNHEFKSYVNHIFIDPSTHKKLVNYIITNNITRILDIGCGYGFLSAILNHRMTTDLLKENIPDFKCIPIELKNGALHLSEDYLPFIDLEFVDGKTPKHQNK